MALKRAAKKKTVKRKVAAKKDVPTKRASAVADPMTKSELYATIAENTELTKKQVTAVLEELGIQVERHLKKRGAGVFTLPGLLKLKVIRKPAVKARKGVNPFTGEEMMFKAKPARNVVKALPLKGLKDMVL
jgi:nucleoid DNA-binding protein